MEEGEFDYWNWSAPLATPRGPEAADGSSLPPPPLSGDGCAGSSNSPLPLIITADGSWSLDDMEDLSMLGGNILTTGTNGSLALQAADWSTFGPRWIHGDDDGLPDHGGGEGEESQDPLLGFDSLDSLLDLDGSSPGSGGANQASVDPQLHAGHPWRMDSLLPMSPPAVSKALLLQQTQVGAGDSPPAAPATGPTNQAGIDQMSPMLPQKEMADVTLTLADMIRIAEECGKDEAASRVWSGKEHRDLLDALRRYAKHDRARSCFYISTYLTNKTALDVALRCRWLQDKEKTAKQADQLAHKFSAGVVKVNMGPGTKGARNSKNMYPLSKEALDSKSTRELLRDSYIFMQQIEDNIKTRELGEETADYFYYVRTNMDAIGKREKEFCRISIPLPPIDEQGLEEILQQSRHKCSPCFGK